MNSLFKISERDHLGIIVMTILAKSYKKNDDWVSLLEISRWGKFSQGYLEQIVPALKKAGLIKSRKGLGGGYKLAIDPKKITMSDIITALHGEMALLPCLDKTSGCSFTLNCDSHQLWSFLQNAISDVLERTTLSDLINPKKLNTNR